MWQNDGRANGRARSVMYFVVLPLKKFWVPECGFKWSFAAALAVYSRDKNTAIGGSLNCRCTSYNYSWTDAHISFCDYKRCDCRLLVLQKRWKASDRIGLCARARVGSRPCSADDIWRWLRRCFAWWATHAPADTATAAAAAAAPPQSQFPLSVCVE